MTWLWSRSGAPGACHAPGRAKTLDTDGSDTGRSARAGRRIAGGGKPQTRAAAQSPRADLVGDHRIGLWAGRLGTTQQVVAGRTLGAAEGRPRRATRGGDGRAGAVATRATPLAPFPQQQRRESAGVEPVDEEVEEGEPRRQGEPRHRRAPTHPISPTHVSKLPRAIILSPPGVATCACPARKPAGSSRPRP